MASKSVVVGRMIVDPDHADIAWSLLYVKNALADIDTGSQSKGKGPVIDIGPTDEELAIKMQEAFLEDAMRGMEDYRLAKSLWEDPIQPSIDIVDQKTVEYLRTILSVSDGAGCVEAEDENVTPDPGIDLDELEHYDSTEACTMASKQAAIEHRQARVANSVAAGLPGPSNIGMFQPEQVEEGDEGSFLAPDIPEALGGQLSHELEEENASDDGLFAHPAELGFKSLFDDGNEDAHVAEPDNAPASTPDLREILGEQFGFATVYCMPCGDLVVGEPTLHAACGHYFCVDCIQDLVTRATTDESLFPPQCCQQPFSVAAFTPFLTTRIQADFDAKRLEFDTPAAQRIFCPNSTCSAFLGSSEGTKTLTCRRCVSDLIAELTLHDIAEIENSRKGKARADAPLSDEEIAFQLQREFWETSMREMADLNMARSLNRAIDSDQAFLNILSITERAAQDDHRAAVSLSQGQALPPLSNAQRLLEDPTFVELARPRNQSVQPEGAPGGRRTSVDTKEKAVNQLVVLTEKLWVFIF
ncbi:hypothetical protein DXG03_002373 [Asterophora parasitica]|uniref:RING-type domain-containing protein n=1 Tax=Asterophora parasitica TaxID=117018 RepID=A0A9P7KCA0_9AGAR|nr:hypothetical protein DXG03_002373 [Asterophora parasitica]